MRSIALLFPALSLLPYATAQSPAWGQCGGFSWNGPTTCVPGVVCIYLGPYYSLCTPECKAPASAGSMLAPASTTSATPSDAPAVARSVLQPRDITGSPIVALDGPASGYYLQKASTGNKAGLGLSSWAGLHLINNGSIRLVDSSSGCVTYPYLNIKPAETSYKPLVFEDEPTTLDWSFDGPDNTLTTSSGFNTFVGCPYRPIYLQTGSDLPADANCTITRLKLGSN